MKLHNKSVSIDKTNFIKSGKDFQITLIHICGIDAIENNDTRLPIQYPLVVVDRSGYDGEFLWNEYLQRIAVKNKERLTWISPWKGEMRSSTMIRKFVTKLNNDNNTDILQTLQNFLPHSCIEYILEYELKNWFKT